MNVKVVHFDQVQDRAAKRSKLIWAGHSEHKQSPGKHEDKAERKTKLWANALLKSVGTHGTKNSVDDCIPRL